MKKIFSTITKILLVGVLTISTTSCIGDKRIAYNVPTDYVLFIEGKPQYELLEDENITKNEDGTQTLDLTSKEVEQFKLEFRQSADEIIDELLNGEKKIATITDITYKDDFSEVTITVDKEKALGIEDAVGLVIGNFAVEEQIIFGGVAEDQVNVNIKLVDSQTGEVISEQQFLDLKAKYYK